MEIDPNGYMALELTKLVVSNNEFICSVDSVYSAYEGLLNKLNSKSGKDNEQVKSLEIALENAQNNIKSLKQQLKAKGMPIDTIMQLRNYVQSNDGDMEPRISKYLLNEFDKWLL